MNRPGIEYPFPGLNCYQIIYQPVVAFEKIINLNPFGGKNHLRETFLFDYLLKIVSLKISD